MLTVKLLARGAVTSADPTRRECASKLLQVAIGWRPPSFSLQMKLSPGLPHLIAPGLSQSESSILFGSQAGPNPLSHASQGESSILKEREHPR